MLVRIAAVAALILLGATLASPAMALTMQECGAKYKAAQDAGTLNGMKWNDFRTANCGGVAVVAAAAPAPAATTAVSAKPSVAAPAGVKFPSAVDPKYAGQTPAKARMHTCLDQYHADKADNGLGGLKWLQKGGGFYSLCNARLKGA